MPHERTSKRFFRGAGLAMLVGVVLAPAFILAPSELGVAALAIAPLAIAASITLAIVGGVIRRVTSASLGALLIGPGLVTVFAAEAATDRAIAAELPIESDALPMPLLSAAMAVLLSAAGPQLFGGLPPMRRERVVIAIIASAMAGAALALDATAWVRGDALSVDHALESIRPTARLAIMTTDETQRARLSSALEVQRTCVQSFCELVIRLDHGGGSRRQLPDELDRAPLAIALLPEVVVVMPLVRGRELDWSRALAFRTATARADDVDASDLGVAVAPPRPWRTSAWIGLGIAIAALILAFAARRTRARVVGAIEAEIEGDRTIRLPGGAIARAPRTMDPGPIVVLDRAPGMPGYREEGLVTIREALVGTRASWLARLEALAIGLELAAIGTILLTHAPLVAAWAAGYAVLGR